MYTRSWTVGGKCLYYQLPHGQQKCKLQRPLERKSINQCALTSAACTNRATSIVYWANLYPQICHLISLKSFPFSSAEYKLHVQIYKRTKLILTFLLFVATCSCLSLEIFFTCKFIIVCKTCRKNFTLFVPFCTICMFYDHG